MPQVNLEWVMFSPDDIKKLSTHFKKETVSHIYIFKIDDFSIGCDDFYFKIGVSEHPWRRLKEVRGCNPFQVSPVFISAVLNPFGVESSLHTLLSPIHRRNEWFYFFSENNSDAMLLDSATSILKRQSSFLLEKIKSHKLGLRPLKVTEKYFTSTVVWQTESE